MSLRDVQIFNHRHYKTIRNVCLGVIFVALIIIPGVLQIQRLDRQTTEITRLNKEVKVLSQRNLDLSKQNVDLNQKNINHTDCVAKIFAQYTKDFVPVTFSDLDNCSINSGTSGSASQDTSSSVSNPSISSTPSSDGQAPSQVSSSGSSSSDNNTTPPDPPQPNIVQRLITDVRNLL